MKWIGKGWCLCLVSVLTAGAAFAWGPKTQTVIVDNAVHLLSKEGNIPINRLRKNLREGTLLSRSMLADLYPGLESNPVRAIENEIYLLRSALGGSVDAYFAYRMGALGKAVAEYTSPMQEGVTTAYQNLYFSDVDNNIDRIPLKNQGRNFVDPTLYFAPLQHMAQANNELILKEYQNGLGFGGLARAALPDDASRSVNAVADVWHTILTGSRLTGVTSENQLGAYVIQAYAYYIQRNNAAELDAADKRYPELVDLDADMRVQIADMYYAAQLYERAVKTYQEVLAMAPDRRDVVSKIAEYHMNQGNTALEEGFLERARDAYQQALSVDPLHPSAEADRLGVEKLIAARDQRQKADQDRLDRAAEYRGLAEEEAMRDHYAEALSLLGQAMSEYEAVTDEFPSEYQQRTRGINDIRFRIREFKTAMMDNAQAFSGSGFLYQARKMAADESGPLDRKALKALLENTIAAEFDQLEDELGGQLVIE